MKRLLLAASLLAAALVLGSLHFGGRLFRASAAPTDFSITAVDCGSTPGTITIQNNSTLPQPLGGLAVVITQPSLPFSFPAGPATFVITTSIVPPIPPPGYTVNPGAINNVQLQVGPGATQTPTPAPNPLAPGQTVALTTAPLLSPGATVQLFDTTSNMPIGPTQGCSQTNLLEFVSPAGLDFIAPGVPNTQCFPETPPAAPTAAAPGPCASIEHAMQFALDGGTIFVEFGFYEICHTIEVNKLVRITTRSDAFTAPNFGAAGTSTAKAGATINGAVLHSFSGDTVFHVTAEGFPDGTSPSNLTNGVPANIQTGGQLYIYNHVAIDGLHIGGAFNPGAAAIFLDNDSYTSVSLDWLGGEDINVPTYTGAPCQPPTPATVKSEIMGNSAGIILSNSDHPNIYGDAILGTSYFRYSPALAVGAVQSGFGIVTSECLGRGPDASNTVQVTFSTIDRNANAGIWLCSDGGGGHVISTNTLRSNGRGVVLRAITTSVLDANTISDDYSDGVVIYDAASNNTLQRNVIESHRTPGSAGIRLGGFGGSLFPLQTVLNNNTLRRNYTGITIAGARSTTGTGNIITAEDERTAIFVQVGSTGSPGLTQPLGTSFENNQIVFNGGCRATAGCAVRLDQFVTADVDATNDNFGLPLRTDVNSVLWHRPNDPTLGFIAANQPNSIPVVGSPVPGLDALGAAGGGLVVTATPPAFSAGNTGAPPVAAGTPGPAPVAGAPVSVATPAPAGAPAGATSAGGAPAAGAAPPLVSATPAATPRPLPGSLFTSPALTTQPAGGATSYTPPCSLVTVSMTVGVSTTSQKFLSMFQPATNIFSAWRFDNATHVYQSMYFADPTAPVDVVTLRPGDVVALCLFDTVTGPP